MHYMIEESNSSIEDVRGRLHAAEKSNDSLQKSLQEQLAERRRLEKTKDEL